jgi:non-ribosomal peptide synthase protein (TIGR01720 family)
MQLDATDTTRLLTGVNQAYGTTIKDILLAALGLAVREVFLAEKVWVMLEGHGREEVLPGVNVSRTVGWFTSLYPVLLSCHDHPDPAVQIKATKETLHQVPHEGIGYGLLEHLSDPAFREQVPFVSPQIAFNYLGQFDQDVENTSLRVAEEPHGHTQDPAQPPQFELSVLGMVTGGRLQLDFRFDPEKHAYPCVEELCFRYQYFLERLIGHCAGKEERERTPSDFGYHDLSLEDLDAINSLFR